MISVVYVAFSRNHLYLLTQQRHFPVEIYKIVLLKIFFRRTGFLNPVAVIDHPSNVGSSFLTFYLKCYRILTSSLCNYLLFVLHVLSLLVVTTADSPQLT